MEVLLPFTLSCEFFPPKTAEGMEHLAETASLLADYHPQFFSVTYGAGGSTQSGTLDSVKMLQQQTPIRIAPHLTCIGARRDEIALMLHQYKSLGIRRLVTLRGDLPTDKECDSEFKFASELVAFVRHTMGDYFHMDVAAYPEFHPQARSVSDDILNLKRKYEAGANSAITQYFFNPDAYFYYLDDCAKQHINLPIIPGIMPITQFASLVRFSDMCGADIPYWIRKRLQSYGNDIDAIKRFGIEVIYKLCQQLIAGGAPGLHFYTLNKSEAVLTLLELLGKQMKPAAIPVLAVKKTRAAL